MKKSILYLALIVLVAGGAVIYLNQEVEDPQNEEVNAEESYEDTDAQRIDIEDDLVGDWQWVETIYNDGEEVRPEGDDFVLTINEDGSISSTTDCNSLAGEVSIYEGNEISFSEIAMTKMYCEGSLEDEYLRTLNDSSTYLFEGDNLVITIKYDSGSTIFEPVE